MGFDLSGEGGYFRAGIMSWSPLLEAAEAFGWQPAGTLPPREPEDFPPDKWSGGYHSNDYQAVTDADARNLAKALRRAIGCAISLKHPGATTGYQPANELERQERALAAAKALNIEHATSFAIFCEAGGFIIG
jgi:hypothetical protein